ncbi:hypothetical protein RCL1_005365 [Eukaryota sp. TZLM3-RCL]
MRIGIDLGTTNCCVAAYCSILSPSGVHLGEQFRLVPSGSFSTTPSYITISNSVCAQFGRESKNKQSMNSANTVFEVKRLIGRRFSESEVQENVERGLNGDPPRWPFKVESDNTNEDKPVISLPINGNDQSFSPEKISGMLLKHLKETAEKFLGESSITEATITCPAYFNDGQRHATMDAAELAGFEDVSLLNEPTAAALAYKQLNSDSIGQRLLVFDFGGGTLDCSIVDIHKDDITVIASGGDCYLGGADIDRVLVDYCLNKFQEQFCQSSREKITVRKMSLLKREVESAKEDLSINETAEIIVDEFFEGQDFVVTLTRQELENRCSSLFQRCLYTVEEVMKRANIRDNQLDAVLLVGGSSRIPKIQEIMKRKFGGKVLSTVQPDHAIAFGACVAHLHTLYDVTSHSLGIRVRSKSTLIEDNTMSIIIPRFSRYPCVFTENYYTCENDQTRIAIDIYQGESVLASENNLLGKFVLSGLPALPAGIASAAVTMSMCKDGILTVTARDRSNSDNSSQLEVNSSKGRLTREQKQVQKIEVNDYFRTLIEKSK